MPKIYIIDDSAVKRSLLSPVLAELGNTWQAGFPDSAKALNDAGILLNAAKSGPGNVVLLDLIIPGQKSVAMAIVKSVMGTEEGKLGDSIYKDCNQGDYQLACYLLGVCLHYRTPVFNISTGVDPNQFIGATSVLTDMKIILPPQLSWPDIRGVGRLRSLCARILPGRIRSVSKEIQEVLKNSANKIKSSMDPYSDVCNKWNETRFKVAIDGLAPWPCPTGESSPFTHGDWHSPARGAWDRLNPISEDIVSKMNGALLELCVRLPGSRVPLPNGEDGVAQYWPVAAVKGIYGAGWISLKLAEWLLGATCEGDSDHLDMFRPSDDSLNAEFLTALCMLANSVGSDGQRFDLTIKKAMHGAQVEFNFSADAATVEAANEIVETLNMDPNIRGQQPGRNGNPGQATLACAKLMRIVPGQFIPEANEATIEISGSVSHQTMT